MLMIITGVYLRIVEPDSYERNTNYENPRIDGYGDHHYGGWIKRKGSEYTLRDIVISKVQDLGDIDKALDRTFDANSRQVLLRVESLREEQINKGNAVTDGAIDLLVVEWSRGE